MINIMEKNKSCNTRNDNSKMKMMVPYNIFPALFSLSQLCSYYECLSFLPQTSFLLLSCLTPQTSVSTCFHHHDYSTASALCCHGDWG